MGAGQETITGTTTFGQALLAKIPDDLAELFLIKTEVVNARDGESTLKDQVDVLQAAIAGKVGLTGNETVAGIKTFSSSPIVPAPTTDLQVSTKKYVDDLAALKVALTGDETIAGVKTFSSSPIVPTPTTDMQASTKKYPDDLVALTLTDYSATSTVTGWASFTTKTIYTGRIGGLSFCIFEIDGDSDTDGTNGAKAQFTVPDTAQYSSVMPLGVAMNAGSYTTNTGKILISGSTSTVQAFINQNSTGWTNSGRKIIQGLLIFRKS